MGRSRVALALEHGPYSQGMAFLLSHLNAWNVNKVFSLCWAGTSMDPMPLQPLIYLFSSQFQSNCFLLDLARISPCVCLAQTSARYLWRNPLTPHQTSRTKLLSSILSYQLQMLYLAAPDSSLYSLSSVDNNVLLAPPPCTMVGKSTQAECQGEHEVHLMCPFLSVRDPAYPIVQWLKTPITYDCPLLYLLTTGG